MVQHTSWRVIFLELGICPSLWRSVGGDHFNFYIRSDPLSKSEYFHRSVVLDLRSTSCTWFFAEKPQGGSIKELV